MTDTAPNALHATHQVLVVDDNDVTREMLRACLADDHQVLQAADGEQALALARTHRLDAIVLDVMLPGLDGYAVCRALKADPATADVPVLFVSVKVTLEERLQGYAAGGDDYVTKPFDLAELHSKVARLVGWRQRAVELGEQVDELMNAALATADMMGEAGVVLEFQRRLSGCFAPTECAQALFDALAAYGLDGCVRLRMKAGPLSLNALGPCTALEESILDHVQTRLGPSIQTLGRHASFHYDTVLLLVRDLPDEAAARALHMESPERCGRLRDSVALLVEGLVARVRSLEAEAEVNRLSAANRLVTLTRQALLDINQQHVAQRDQLAEVFARLRADLEESFIHLGLTQQQEDHLSEMLRRHLGAATGIFERSGQVNEHMERLIGKLRQGTAAA
ncbi:response regulator with CheY-like receiver domain and winged-helix DNA-binding domain [Burkholderiales bacterium JOSHI_001]|nr:response regulator with CheY-like receiver domain and winged-helix DNA-binding domain [Burkholderiales bacterium JOSHI_001]